MSRLPTLMLTALLLHTVPAAAGGPARGPAGFASTAAMEAAQWHCYMAFADAYAREPFTREAILRRKQALEASAFWRRQRCDAALAPLREQARREAAAPGDRRTAMR